MTKTPDIKTIKVELFILYQGAEVSLHDQIDPLFFNIMPEGLEESYLSHSVYITNKKPTTTTKN